MTGWIGGAVAFYAGLVVLLYVAQRSLLYHPDQTIPDPQLWRAPAMQAVKIPTKDALELYAWWHPPATPDHPTIAYFHGNAGHIGDRAEKTADYLDQGYGLLLVSWRYNAGAGGKPSEPALLEDGRAAIAFLEEQNNIRSDRIVLYGESLGSGVAVQMAASHPVGAVVLEAPYTSVAEVAQSHYWYVPARWLVRDSFDSMAYIKEINAPLLVVHGEQDRVIPMRFGHTLFEAAVEPKEFVPFPLGRHDDLDVHGLAAAVIDFLDRRLVEKARAASGA